MQDKYGLNVNLLLFCAYAARGGRIIPRSDFVQIASAIEPLERELIQPLRAARRSAAAQQAGLKERLLEAELAAEKFEEETLEAHFARLAETELPVSTCFRENLGNYASAPEVQGRLELFQRLLSL